MKIVKVIAVLLVSYVAFTAIIIRPALAQAIRAPSSGGLTQAAADLLYCALAGCTMTGGTVYSGVTTDISTAGAEDLTLSPGGGIVATKGLTISGVTTDMNTPDGEDLTVMGGGTSGTSGFLLMKSRADQVRILDRSDGVDFVFTATATAASGATLALVDFHTDLTSADCDGGPNETGRIRMFQDGNVVAPCACVQTGAGTYAWVAMTATGDCTP